MIASIKRSRIIIMQVFKYVVYTGESQKRVHEAKDGWNKKKEEAFPFETLPLLIRSASRTRTYNPAINSRMLYH
jgi:hypothetical protein